MILMYHNIAKEPGFNTVAVKQFKNQLDFIIENGYRIVSMDNYVEALKNNNFHKHNICITFDDAYRSLEEEVIPILEERNLPATVFVPAGFIGKYNVWDEEISNTRLEILNEHELRKLSKNRLVTIGSHGVSHQPLSKLNSGEMRNEIVDSKNQLKEITGSEIKYFSYPFGQHKHFNSTTIQVIKEAGYEAAVSTNWNRNNSVNNLYSLNRIEIEPKDNIDDFRQKITQHYHLKFFKQIAKNFLRF